MSYNRGSYGGYGNYGRSNGDYYSAKHPSNRQPDRRELAATTDDRRDDDDNKYGDGKCNTSARNYNIDYRAPYKPANNKHATDNDEGKGSKEEEEEMYGKPASRQTYDSYASWFERKPFQYEYDNREKNQIGCEKKPFQYEYDRADRRTEDPPPRKYGGGFQQNQYSVRVHDDDDDDKNDGENEQIRKDFANRFILFPGRRNAIEKKDGQPSNGQPQVVVIKKLEFKVDRSKIENLGMTKGRAK